VLDGELTHVAEVVAVTVHPVVSVQLEVVLQDTGMVCPKVGAGQIVVTAQELTVLVAQLEEVIVEDR